MDLRPSEARANSAARVKRARLAAAKQAKRGLSSPASHDASHALLKRHLEETYAREGVTKGILRRRAIFARRLKRYRCARGALSSLPLSLHFRTLTLEESRRSRVRPGRHRPERHPRQRRCRVQSSDSPLPRCGADLSARLIVPALLADSPSPTPSPTVGCQPGFFLTGGVCVQSASTCGPNTCGTTSNGAFLCAGGNVCTLVCDTINGFVATPQNTCVNLVTSEDNCGAIGNVCPPSYNGIGSPWCRSRQCGLRASLLFLSLTSRPRADRLTDFVRPPSPRRLSAGLLQQAHPGRPVPLLLRFISLYDAPLLGPSLRPFPHAPLVCPHRPRIFSLTRRRRWRRLFRPDSCQICTTVTKPEPIPTSSRPHVAAAQQCRSCSFPFLPGSTPLAVLPLSLA